MKTLIVLFLLLPMLALAQSVEVFTLKHRQAEDMIPLIQPMLSKGDAISGSGNKLIVRARHMGDIKKLVARLDKVQAILKITVYQGVGTEGPPDDDSYSTDSGHASYVRTVEGSPAYIRVGRTVQENNAVFYGPYGSGASAVTRAVTSGFYVLAHLNGDKVSLDVSPMLDHPAADAVDLTRLSTKIEGKLGEWMEIGGSGQIMENDSIQAGGNDQRIWVKVESP